MSNLKPMDIFSSRMDIPFDVAAYSRQHKLCVEVVKLYRALQTRQEAEQKVKAAEATLGAAESEVSVTIQAVRAKMEREDLL